MNDVTSLKIRSKFNLNSLSSLHVRLVRKLESTHKDKAINKNKGKL